MDRLAPVVIDESYIVTTDEGRRFVEFAGLLDAARPMLVEMHCSLDQAPTKANDYMAICTCRIALQWDDGVITRHSNLGHADYDNTTLHKSLVAVAETRAISRTLRMALKLDLCSVEELPQDDNGDHTDSFSGKPMRTLVEKPVVTTLPTAPTRKATLDELPITSTQAAMIRKLVADLGVSPPADLMNYSKAEALKLMGKLRADQKDTKRNETNTFTQAD